MGAVTAAVIGGAAMVGSTYMAGQEAKKGRKAAERMAQKGAEAFAAVDLPDIEKQKIQLLASELQGEYRPELEQALGLGPSAMEDISADEQLLQAQRDSLEGISEIAEGGMTEADLAANREIRREIDQSAAARQKAVLNQMAQRGVLGSGMELAAQLSAQQEAADRQSRAGDTLTQQAQARALAALQNQGSMAGQMRGQDFSEDSAVARARDAIDKFNTVNRQSVIQRNISEQNRAQAANLAARQAQADQAAALRNQQEMYNKGLIQQQYDNEMRRAAGLSNQYANVGAAQQGAANARAQQIAGIGSAIGNIAGAFGNMSAAKPTPAAQPANSAVNTTIPGAFDPSKIA